MNAPQLASTLAFLSHGASYGAGQHRVERIETHMSWVFLSADFAYKLKKPIHVDLIDFTTVEARLFYCQEELRLNRRLSPDIYLAVVPITLDGMNQLHLDGEGTPVEWLVKMRRLPAARMLDAALSRRSVPAPDIRRLAAMLATFHNALPTEPVDAIAYRDRFGHQLQQIQDELGEPRYAIERKHLDVLGAAQARALLSVSHLLETRVHQGKVIEGHGDLRAEHVCMLPKIAIIDCLEFSRDLRILDRADELGFLALECERLGARGMAELLLRSYARYASDAPEAALVHFYQSFRASKRALIALRHLREDQFSYSPHWRRTALSYLALAAEHAAHCTF
ncbi:hypothetical protein RBA41_03470 [Massilia sp. CCM 9210]|uniref:hypothetical protein n=1 Tax=Massilia scottii TaxID=3057166 RepID=UPI0027968539|nr:hypothetical protein [Massilia sp. CCM 9210]MDQ1812354.1 hypothetical protein [Massilia sp. CCM 9210]